MKFQKLYLLIILCLFSNVSWSGECLQGDCKNGLGTYLWDSGDKYVGEFSNGLANGEGLYTTADGDVYEGGFKNQKFHGHGKWSRANGDVYVGEFNDNDPHGSGIYKVSDGRTIEGTFTKGQLTAGILISQDGSATDVITGEPVDRSSLVSSKVDGPKNQNSVITTQKYVLKEECKFIEGANDGELIEADCKNGQGSFTWTNGTKYVGEYQDNLPHGQGIYTSSDGIIYEGELKENLLSGKGTLRWTNGNKYVGEFSKVSFRNIFLESALEEDRDEIGIILYPNGGISDTQSYPQSRMILRTDSDKTAREIIIEERERALNNLDKFIYKDYEKSMDYRYQIDRTIRPLVKYQAPQILIDNVVALKCPNIRKIDAHNRDNFYNQGDLYMQFLFSNESIDRKIGEECKSRLGDPYDAIKVITDKGIKSDYIEPEPLLCEFRRTNVMHQFFINHNDYNKYTQHLVEYKEERGYVFNKSNLIKNPRNGLSNYYRSISSSTGINDVNKISLIEYFRSGVSGELDRETLILDILPEKRKIELIPSKSEQERYQIRLLKARASTSVLEEAIVKDSNPKYTSAYDIKEVKSYQCELVKWTDMLKEKEAYLLKREHHFQEIINNRNNSKEQKIEKRTF